MSEITTISNDQISHLVDSLVKKDFTGNEYDEVLAQFEEKLKNVNVEDYPTIDDFVFECVSLFEDVEEEGPDEIYRGLNREDIQLLIESIIKRFKELLCDTFQRYPTENFADATNNIFEKHVEMLVGSVLAAAGVAGIPAIYIGMMLVTFLTYISKSKMQAICE